MDGQLRYPTLVPYEDPSDWEVADPGTTDMQATLELSVGFVSWTGIISEVLAGEELAVGRCQHRDLHRLWPRLMSLKLVCPNPEANYWISLQCLESTSSGMLLEHLWWCIHSIDWCEDICHPRDVSNLNVDLKTCLPDWTAGTLPSIVWRNESSLLVNMGCHHRIVGGYHKLNWILLPEWTAWIPAVNS